MLFALSTNRSKAGARFYGALLLCMALCGCGEEVPSNAPQVVRTAPLSGDSWAADRLLRITFDRYLDASSINPAIIRLQSGGVSFAVVAGYDPVDRALVVRPLLPLRPGLGYSLTVEAGAVAAVGGGALEEAVGVEWRAGPAVGGESAADGLEAAAVDFDRDVAPIFAGRCGCHGPEAGVFPALEPGSLVGEPSARVAGAVLVAAGAPLQSELVRRILPDYPGVRGMEKVLSDAERRVIVRWVAGLR